ncbi:MAG TPA: ATP synthase F1 subunit gamma [Candidatus Binataceae bacterium]|nr:ATP synthase F1 subunit gamma [Candidatus Binataceae bacterium]
MPTLKAIRRRIASVKSTQQITRAMKLVAASRLRRAQEALENSLPYSEALTRVADSVLGAQRATLGPAEGAANASFVVVVTSDRGLCGGYNANILKFTEQKAAELRAAGLPPQFFVVGRKGLDNFKRTNTPMIGNSINNPRLVNVALARDIAHRMLNAYQSGQAREIGIIYSHFRSAISQQPVYEKLLPISEYQGGEGQTEGASAKAGHGSTEYLVEPSREQLIPLVIRTYIEAAVFHALVEAEASFFGAQMTSMDNATNNATEMIQSLTLEMNRARQAMITKELMDIVGGAEALKGQAS